MWRLDRDSFVVLLIITKIVWVRVYFDCVRVIIWLEEYEGHDLSSVLLHTFLVPVMKLITKKQKGFNGRKGSWVKPLCQIDRSYGGENKAQLKLDPNSTRIQWLHQAGPVTTLGPLCCPSATDYTLQCK